MKKRFLLIAGDDYFPSTSIAEGAWIDFFDTREEAENCVEYSTETRYRITLPSGHYTFVNWHRIIDIEEWEDKRYDYYHIWHEPDETSDWYDCAHCEAGYPDQECTCEGFIKGEE